MYEALTQKNEQEKTFLQNRENEGQRHFTCSCDVTAVQYKTFWVVQTHTQLNKKYPTPSDDPGKMYICLLGTGEKKEDTLPAQKTFGAR